MQKKTSSETTQPLLSLGKNIREYIAVVQAIITAFVAVVAVVISIRTQPIVDSIRTLDAKVAALESNTNDYRKDVKQIMEELFTIKGEIKRIK